MIKTANLENDLRKKPELEKYFVTEEKAKLKLDVYNEEKKKGKRKPYYSSDYDWYKVEGESEDFYLYQDFCVAISDILYARCKVLQLNRRGYDDPVSIAGLYEADGDNLIGYKIFKGYTYTEVMREISKYGIHDEKGRHYICNETIYNDFYELKEVAIDSVTNKDKNTGQTFHELNQ
jgi:hypothetical protein